MFNRPDHVKQSLEALEECYLAADSVMYIFSDTSEDEEKRIEQVREYIKKKRKHTKRTIYVLQVHDGYFLELENRPY